MRKNETKRQPRADILIFTKALRIHGQMPVSAATNFRIQASGLRRDYKTSRMSWTKKHLDRDSNCLRQALLILHHTKVLSLMDKFFSAAHAAIGLCRRKNAQGSAHIMA